MSAQPFNVLRLSFTTNLQIEFPLLWYRDALCVDHAFYMEKDMADSPVRD